MADTPSPQRGDDPKEPVSAGPGAGSAREAHHVEANGTDATGEATAGADDGSGSKSGTSNSNVTTNNPLDQPGIMPVHIFVLALIYLILLAVLFIAYVSSPSFRSGTPTHFGQLPMGILWFGATGAVMASLFGIFTHNREWKPSYNYWHYCRPLFGAVAGSIGALIYLVLLKLGNSSSVKVDDTTFYVAAFVFGFADGSFIQLIQNVTAMLIRPSKKS
jgi:hypothetical protein